MENVRPEDENLQKRTKTFSLNVIKLFQALAKNTEGQIIGKQILRSGTSVGANTRAAFRGRSTKEFYAKIGIVIEEADECIFWSELLEESGIHNSDLLTHVKKESEELVSIFVSISKRNNNK